MVTPADINSSSHKAGWWRMIRPPVPTRWVLLFFCVLLVAFTLTRILFYALYGDLAIKLSMLNVLRSFMVGMRFDIATVAVLLLPWTLLIHLPLAKGHRDLLRRILTPCLILVGAVVSVIAVADCVYYAHAAKRFSYEPLLFFQIGDKLIEFAFGEHPILTPFVLTCVFLYWGIFWYWTRRKFAPHEQRTQLARVRIVIWGLLLLGLSIIGARGG